MNPERNENKENSENNLKCNRKEEKTKPERRLYAWKFTFEWNLIDDTIA